MPHPQLSSLPLLPGDTRLHLGVVIAVGVAVLGYVLLFRSAFGDARLRSVGHNPLRLQVTWAWPSSAASCRRWRSAVQCSGVAGAILVFGSESHRLIGEGGAAGRHPEPRRLQRDRGGTVRCAAPVVDDSVASFFFGGMLTGGPTHAGKNSRFRRHSIVALNGVRRRVRRRQPQKAPPSCGRLATATSRPGMRSPSAAPTPSPREPADVERLLHRVGARRDVVPGIRLATPFLLAGLGEAVGDSAAACSTWASKASC